MKQDIYVLIEHQKGRVNDISYVMLAAGKKLAAELGTQVVALLLGYNEPYLAEDLAADRILYYDHPELSYFVPNAYQKVLADIILRYRPRLVLFGDTSIGAEVAGPLSIRLNLPLVSYCRTLQVQHNSIHFASQICGGKLMGEAELPAETVLVMMIPGAYKPEHGRSASPSVIVRATPPPFEKPVAVFKHYLNPSSTDIDISNEPLLIAVGRGIQNQENLEMIADLAEALGAKLCASRPVVDQGWMPTSRLVGKSGKRVKPALYLALGISGATEHIEAITESDMIIAVNTDPAAPIFNLATYGTTVDLFELVPALTNAILLAREMAASSNRHVITASSTSA